MQRPMYDYSGMMSMRLDDNNYRNGLRERVQA